jgi:uncharacterized membrane protein
MNKTFLFALSSIFVLILFFLIFRGARGFIGFNQPQPEFAWWNISWKYRFEIEINSTDYDRTDFPIEYKINFTDLLPSWTFDENSIRVVEYSTSGSMFGEVPSQFDKNEDYDSSANAAGTLVFSLNGTTEANTNRIYFVYYDTVENGVKDAANYPTSLTYDRDGQQFSVNNTLLSFWVDTARGENTSGLIRVRGIESQNDILKFFPPLPTTDRTYEYSEYSNGTYNFSFDFANNATVKYIGPVRMVVEQKGDETIWNTTNKTEGFMTKRYVFYNNLQWIRIETNFTNIGSTTINRNSTFAGAIAIDASRAFGANWQDIYGNATQPGWWMASDRFGSVHAGIIQFNQTGTNNFWVPNSTSQNRTGIQLNTTSISPGSSIIEDAVIHFNDTQADYTQVRDLRDRFADPIKITQSLPERWYVAIAPSTNTSVYNRNETILIVGNNFVGDPYNLTKYMNATIDMGTASPNDDQTIVLHDDGTNGDSTANDKVFSGVFNISNDGTVGIWSINFTTYSNDFIFLNSTSFNFNVTDILNTSVNVTTKKVMVGSNAAADIFVKNYRQDSWISGATINCSYGSLQVTNKTDYDNGTYSVNFTAPVQEGIYNLYCNATSNGNFGNGTDSFTVEAVETNVSITAQPSNPSVSKITLYSNDSFVITVNATNSGNATAYDSNTTLELLNGWAANSSLHSCGNLDKLDYCASGFNITVPNATPPGNYYINATEIWRNPDGSIYLNKTQVNVTVASNPKVSVVESKISGEGGDGISVVVGNFTVFSIGNDQLSNITFSCISGNVCNNFAVSFIPTSISNLSSGLGQSVMANITIPLGYPAGTYNGTVNVSAQNADFDSFILETVVPAKSNVSIVTVPSTYVSHNITELDNESFSFSTNATDIKNASARFVNISLSLPPFWSSNASVADCGNLTKSDFCSQGFSVTIPNATDAGNYYVNVSAYWTNPDNSLSSNKTSLIVTVASNPKIDVKETNVSGTVLDGAQGTIGNFTVLSVGNDVARNINMNCISGEVCRNFTVTFIPASISSIDANHNQNVIVNVTVPLSYPAGTYNGTVNVSAQNANFDTINLEVTVPENRTWALNPSSCTRSTQQSEGTACEVNVTNLGNVQINFTVFPSQGNYTAVNETSFVVNRSSFHTFNVTYNTTGVAPSIYNSTFVVNATQSNANPANRTLSVYLFPFVPPILNISMRPNEMEQNASFVIYANVTDRSGSGISWAKVDVTHPDGTVDSVSMILNSTNGNLTRWALAYPGIAYGSTMQRGIHNVTVYTEDNIGNIGNINSSFLVYTKLDLISSTVSDKYFQGDSGSIFYIARNLSGAGISNVNTSFTVMDSNHNITFISSNFTTNSDGTITPLPTFAISSDSFTGNYSLISYSAYFDSIANRTLQVQKNSTFQVLSRTITVTGLFADIDTAVVWYPSNNMTFGILVYNGEGRPVDPTSMNLTVYDPVSSLYLTVNMSQMTKEAVGYYMYVKAMGADTPSGMFLAVLNVAQGDFQTMKLKAFRVAHGGPYDVRITPLENEVPQGGYLDFVLTIENKGEVTQDVNVQYWVSSLNNTYFSKSVLVETPTLSNQSFTDSVPIYSTQPLGNYFLNAKVTYDVVQSPLLVNASFIVVSPAANVTTGTTTFVTVPYPYSGAAVAATATTTAVSKMNKISISKYNSNMSLARGFSGIESIVVNNTGDFDLHNVSLALIGVPTNWFNITPNLYNTVQVGNSSMFIINFNIPQNVTPGSFSATLIASSSETLDQKRVTVTVFESLEELLRVEIQQLKDDFQDLQVDARVAEREGKDISAVTVMINEIKSQIDSADQNLANGRTADALSNVSNARNLILEARDLLSRLTVLKPPAFVIPMWGIFVLIIIIIAAILSVVLWKKKKVPMLRPWIVTLGKSIDTIRTKKTVSQEDIQNERQKLLRMLEVLEKEKDDKIISSNAYREMKKTIEKKLAKIEGRIY